MALFMMTSTLSICQLIVIFSSYKKWIPLALRIIGVEFVKHIWNLILQSAAIPRRDNCHWPHLGGAFAGIDVNQSTNSQLPVNTGVLVWVIHP